MKFDKNTAQVVYASDDKFAEILGVSMVSLYENSKDMDDIIVYILESGISTANKKKLNSVAENYHCSVPVWIKAKDIRRVLGIAVAVDRGSLSQYARLFVTSDLPKNLERVLYLDCDTIINKSIRELWNIDLHGKTIAALMDAFSKYYRVNIDLQPNDIMFNSGVMLIDLNRWKEQQVEQQLLKFICSKKGKIQQGDQGALNAILSHDTYCIEPRFNSVTIFYDFTYTEMLIYRKPPKFYSKEQIQKAIEEPNVIHFTTSFKSLRPWLIGCKHRHVNEWLKYKALSPWNESNLYKDTRPEWKKKCLNIYNKMPRNISLYLVGVIQAYGRPLKNKMRLGK